MSASDCAFPYTLHFFSVWCWMGPTGICSGCVLLFWFSDGARFLFCRLFLLPQYPSFAYCLAFCSLPSLFRPRSLTLALRRGFVVVLPFLRVPFDSSLRGRFLCWSSLLRVFMTWGTRSGSFSLLHSTPLIFAQCVSCSLPAFLALPRFCVPSPPFLALSRAYVLCLLGGSVSTCLLLCYLL